MATLTAREHVEALRLFSLQLRLLLSVGWEIRWVPSKVVGMTYGLHALSKEELTLSLNDRQDGGAALEHTATFTLALAVTQALRDVFVKPREHAEADVRAAFEIARLLRNAYAHQPFRPTWSIDPDCVGKVYEVADVIHVDTGNLQGRPVRWQDYGGKLALLRLCERVRDRIAVEALPASSSAP